MADPRRFRAVVADDERVARDAVSTLLRDQPAVEVVGEAASGDEAVAVVKRLRPDLLFLDVQMPGGDGFRVLEALGGEVPRGVVFVTAFDEHAVRAFEVHALDYVVKPFGKPRFDAAVARAVARLEAEEALTLRRTLEALVAGRRTAGDPAGTLASGAARPENLAVRVGTRIVLVPVAEVDWIESDADYARIHAAGKAHLVSARMHALEELLDPRSFLRIHRSVIVNLARVSELQRDDDGAGTVVLRSGVRLRVARGRWEELERALSIG
jgi:two-component system, LytTR family, response regulator